MNVVDVFSLNLSALMRSRGDLDTQVKLGAAADIGPTNIGRFRRGDVAAQIDSVEKVAKAFRLRACDILDPDLTRRLQAGEPLRMGEPKPPVMAEDDWRALSPRARALVEELCDAALEGQISDEDITWLHNSLQRITKPAHTPPTPPVPSPGAAPKFMVSGQSGGNSQLGETINNHGDTHFGVPPTRARRK